MLRFFGLASLYKIIPEHDCGGCNFLALDDPDLWIVSMSFDVDIGNHDPGDFDGPSRNVLHSMARISLQEISGSSTSMMEEKTMNIKDIFARHGSRLCPLSIAEAKQLKGDSDELWDRVASQSGAVAGDDGGGSVLCMPLCAGQIQQNVDLISR